MIDVRRTAGAVASFLKRVSQPVPDTDEADLVPVGHAAASRFRWEAEMLGPVVTNARILAPWLDRPSALVAEVPAAVGIVDLLGIRFNRRVLNQRIEGDVRPVLSPLRVRVLYALLTGPAPIDELAASVGSNGEALMRSTLRPLHAAELIELEDGIARATGLWRPVAGRVVAVELKLSKWRDALSQADNSGHSADERWVVLDAARAAGALAALDEFSERGVGLAVVEQGGGLHVLQLPVRGRPEGWLRALIAERALEALDDYEPVFSRSPTERLRPKHPRVPSKPHTVAIVT